MNSLTINIGKKMFVCNYGNDKVYNANYITLSYTFGIKSNFPIT